MDIESIGEILEEGKIQGKEKSALEFLIQAISDFPITNLTSASDYVIAIKQLLNKTTVTIQDLVNYLDTSPFTGENVLWQQTSITSLVHSIETMNSSLTVDDFITDLQARTQVEPSL